VCLVHGKELSNGKASINDPEGVRTPHLQCYVVFKSARHFSAIVKMFEGPNIETALGDNQQVSEHCEKGNPTLEALSAMSKEDRGPNENCGEQPEEEGRIFEFGEPPKDRMHGKGESGDRSNLLACRLDAESGVPKDAMFFKCKEIEAKCPSWCNKVHQRAM